MRQYSYRLRLYPNTSQEEFLAKQVCDTKMKREYRNNVPIVVY